MSATARTHLVTVYGMAYHMMHLQLANESLTRERAPLHPVTQRWIHAQRYGRAKRTHTGKSSIPVAVFTWLIPPLMLGCNELCQRNSWPGAVAFQRSVTKLVIVLLCNESILGGFVKVTNLPYLQGFCYVTKSSTLKVCVT